MAKELDEPLVKVSYHANVLKESGCIEKVRPARRRGALEHYFKATPRSSLGSMRWDTLPPAVRQSIAAASFETLTAQVAGALKPETFEHPDGSHISWQPLSVDELGWSEIADILSGVDADFKAVAKKSRRRLKDKDGISVAVVAGVFQNTGRRTNRQ